MSLTTTEVEDQNNVARQREIDRRNMFDNTIRNNQILAARNASASPPGVPRRPVTPPYFPPGSPPYSPPATPPGSPAASYGSVLDLDDLPPQLTLTRQDSEGAYARMNQGLGTRGGKRRRTRKAVKKSGRRRKSIRISRRRKISRRHRKH